MEIIEVNSASFNEYISKGNILVSFYANWCGQCRMIDLELEKIKDLVQIIKINADKNRSLCKQYGVMSLPTIIYFKNDGSYVSKSGYMNSNKIIDIIRK